MKGNLQVLAQCGSFLPSEKSRLNIKHRLFALTGDYSNQSHIKKQSSFERELAEINYVLQNLSADSLILIDELCRNTNYYEGVALALAICEYILENAAKNKANITVFFATHYTELAFLQYLYSTVNCFYFESVYDQKQKKLNHTYELKKGVNRLKNYGLLI